MKELIVDGKCMESREAMYIHLTRVFSLPSHFGNNLDALWDVLTETEEQTQITFIHTDIAKEYLGNYAKELLKLFNKLADENENYFIYLE